MSAWTDAEKSKVVEFIAAGMSASAIAAQFEGRTRNAVIGLSHRMQKRLKNPSGWFIGNNRGKPGPKSVSVADTDRRKMRKGKPAKILKFEAPKEIVEPVTPVPAFDAPEPFMVPLVDNHGCKWPYGDPKEESFGFCGHDRDGLGPYCTHHARIAFVPLPIRRKAA